MDGRQGMLSVGRKVHICCPVASFMIFYITEKNCAFLGVF